MIDGAMVNTTVKDSSGSSYRENKLAVIFNSKNIQYYKSKNGEIRHTILNREYISYIGKSDEFIYHVFALALRNGYGKFKKIVLISDGASWIKTIKITLFSDAIHILDLYHLKENTFSFFKAIYNDNKELYNPIAEKICEMLENGKCEEVLKQLEKYKDIKLKDVVVNLYTYLSNNIENIDYPSYRKQGLFVGSGAIESGNKVILKNRFKLQGMIWSVTYLQNYLALKTKFESGLWESVVTPLVMREPHQKSDPLF